MVWLSVYEVKLLDCIFKRKAGVDDWNAYCNTIAMGAVVSYVFNSAILPLTIRLNRLFICFTTVYSLSGLAQHSQPVVEFQDTNIKVKKSLSTNKEFSDESEKVGFLTSLRAKGKISQKEFNGIIELCFDVDDFVRFLAIDTIGIVKNKSLITAENLNFLFNHLADERDAYSNIYSIDVLGTIKDVLPNEFVLKIFELYKDNIREKRGRDVLDVFSSNPAFNVKARKHLLSNALNRSLPNYLREASLDHLAVLPHVSNEEKHDPSQLRELVELAISPSELSTPALESLKAFQFASSDIFQLIEKKLDDSDLEVRRSAILALIQINKNSEKKISDAIHDKDPNVQREAIFALLSLSDSKASKNILLNLLSKNNSNIEEMILYAINRRDEFTQTDAELLYEIYHNTTNKDVQNRAYSLIHSKYLTRLDKIGLITPLMEAKIHSTSPETKLRALTVLNEVYIRYNSTLFKMVKGLLSSSNDEIHKIASEIVGRAEKQIQTASPMPLPTDGNSNDLCRALEDALKLNEQRQLTHFNADEIQDNTDSWDFALSSLQNFFQTKYYSHFKIIEEKPTPLVFQKSMEAVMSRSLSSKNKKFSGSDIYGMTFSILENKERGDHSKTARFLEALQIIEKEREARGVSGSGFITFTWGVSMLAMHPNVSSDSKTRFLSWVDSFEDPLNLPYTPTLHPELNSRTGSAARNVPVHLAAFKMDSNDARRSTLISALDNWLLYAGNLLDEVPKSGGHEGHHGLAPYYFYSSLPYVTAASKLLLDTKDLKPTEVEKLKLLRAALRKLLPRLIKDESLLSHGGAPSLKERYHSAKSYNAALLGLAIFPLLEEQDSCYRASLKADYGIVAH